MQSSHQNQGHTHNDIVSILLTKKSKRYRSFQTNSNENFIETYQANGSVYSIINWVRQAKLDDEQKRAFGIIIGSFVLTFFNEATIVTDSRACAQSFFLMKRIN